MPARRGLCGGLEATPVPTATVFAAVAPANVGEGDEEDGEDGKRMIERKVIVL